MMGSLAINITSEGKKLRAGDVIQLELYTPLHHEIKEEEAPPRPLVHISKFSPDGHNGLSKAEDIKNPLASSGTYCHEVSGKTHIGCVEAPECNGKLCSRHGIGMIVCVCKSKLINKINLQTLKDECWFATEEVAVMSPSHKRCMIYWWFATNIYGICDTHNRDPLPDCLVAAVRKEYPETTGDYTGFKL